MSSRGTCIQDDLYNHIIYPGTCCGGMLRLPVPGPPAALPYVGVLWREFSKETYPLYGGWDPAVGRYRYYHEANGARIDVCAPPHGGPLRTNDSITAPGLQGRAWKVLLQHSGPYCYGRAHSPYYPQCHSHCPW